MAHRRSFSSVATFPILFLLSFFICEISAIVLQDLPHVPEQAWQPHSSRIARRKASLSGLELKSTETFIWGAPQQSQALIANLTVSVPGAQQNVLSLQRFKDHLQSVQCTKETIDLEFKNNAIVEFAQRKWEWVNGAESHTFVLVAGTGDCGWNEYRLPFVVSNLEFRPDTNRIHLKAQASSWKDAFHTYTLRVGEVPLAKGKRQVSGSSPVSLLPDISFGIDYKLPNAEAIWTFPFQGQNMSLKLDCNDCGTQGRFRIGLSAETILSTPAKMELFLKPVGVSARVVPKLSISTNLTDPYTLLEKEWPSSPFTGIIIPGGLLNIAPEMAYSVGVQLGPLVASAALSGGVVASIDDSASMTYDLLGSQPFAQSGWAPKIGARDWILDEKVSGDLGISAKAKLQVSTTVLGLEYKMGVSLTPHTSARLEVVASFGGPACPNDPELNGYGVKLTPRFGAGVKFDVTNGGNKTRPLMEYDFGSIEREMADMCIGFGGVLPTSVSEIATVKPTDTSTNIARSTIAPPKASVATPSSPALLPTASPATPKAPAGLQSSPSASAAASPLKTEQPPASSAGLALPSSPKAASSTASPKLTFPPKEKGPTATWVVPEAADEGDEDGDAESD